MAAISALVLLVAMFVPAWYGARIPGVASLDGFHSLTGLRWLVLITLAVAFALVFLQGAQAPALPAAQRVRHRSRRADVTVDNLPRADLTPSSTGPYKQTAAAYIGLASVLVLTYSGYRSMREEDKPESGPQRGDRDRPPRRDGLNAADRALPAFLEWGPMLDRAQVLHVARLAQLDLDDDEVERMAAELSKVLDHVERIRELDLDGRAADIPRGRHLQRAA